MKHCVCVFHGIHMHSPHVFYWILKLWEKKTKIKAQPLSNETSMQSWCVECWNAQQVFSNGQYAQESGLPLVSMAWFSSYIHQGHISLTSINAMFPFITWLYVLTSHLLPNVAERPYAYESCSNAGSLLRAVAVDWILFWIHYEGSPRFAY
jgi:hypothetical protein